MGFLAECTTSTHDKPSFFLRGLGLDDRYDLAVLDELHLAVLEGEESEVAALADVLTGVNLCSALADDDGAGLEELAVIRLDAEILRVGVASVAG